MQRQQKSMQNRDLFSYDADQIRNIAVIAHVDHGILSYSDQGKTTLTDTLLYSSNVISKHSVGKLRYMDWRKDEQIRGITMKSACISIPVQNSPGHVEFSADVAYALRLADGALILVDVVEGIANQTQGVAAQCIMEKASALLVLNKMDRLFKELHLEPEEIALQLQKIIEQANAIIETFKDNNYNLYSNELSAVQDSNVASKESEVERDAYFSAEKDNIVFCSAVECWGFRCSDFLPLISQRLKIPEQELKGKLLGDFYFNQTTKKISDSPTSMRSKTLFTQFVLESFWKLYQVDGNTSADERTKICSLLKVPTCDSRENQFKNRFEFAHWILPQWLPLDRTLIGSIAEILPSPKTAQRERISVFAPWYNVNKQESTSSELQNKIVERVMECSSNIAEPVVGFICKLSLYDVGPNVSSVDPANHQQLRMVAIARLLTGTVIKGQELYLSYNRNMETFDSDSIKQGKRLSIKLHTLYMLRSPNLLEVEKVSAGHIFGIGGLDHLGYGQATFSSIPNYLPFAQVNLGTTGLLLSSITTKNVQDTSTLIQALKSLNRADPSVIIQARPNGDLVLGTCGQTHLERCLFDLQTWLGEIEICVSEPIVAFRETVTYKNPDKINNDRSVLDNNDGISQETQADMQKSEDENDEDKATFEIEEFVDLQKQINEDIRYGLKIVDETAHLSKDSRSDRLGQTWNKKKAYQQGQKGSSRQQANKNVISASTANRHITIVIRCLSLSFPFSVWLEEHNSLIPLIRREIISENQAGMIDDIRRRISNQIDEFIENRSLRQLIYKHFATIGPAQTGPNMLLIKPKLLENVFFDDNKTNDRETKGSSSLSVNEPLALDGAITQLMSRFQISLQELLRAVIAGFDLATEQGPLCGEPLMGTCFIVEKIELSHMEDNFSNGKATDGQIGEQNGLKDISGSISDPYGPILGQVMSAVKEACHRSFLGANPRLVEGSYDCHILCDQDSYGKVFSVLNRRRATINEETLLERSNLFSIRSSLPSQESIGFHNEISIKASGRASASLRFAGWQTLNLDPFYTPQTKEELEDEGEIVRDNLAKQLIEKIRITKGLHAEQKTVVSAEKQRNLSKKK